MRAILIDPHSETISEVVYDGNWRTISKWIDADRFDAVSLDHDDTAYVDDEGLFREDQKFFIMKGWPQPLAGKALVLGTDEEGESIDAHTNLDLFRKKIKFMDRQTVAMLAKFGAFK